jgi:diguanylate cyclase (GGDEF)-like protein
VTTTETSPAATPDSRRSGGFRVVLLTCVLTCTSLALLRWGPVSGLGPVRHLIPQLAIGAVLVVLSAAAVLAPVSFHHRGHTYLFSLGEVPLLLGLVFAAPVVLVLGRLTGGVIGLGGVRRQPPVKLTFNLASGAFTAVVADTVYREIIGAHSALGPTGWVAGAVALVVAALTAQVAVSLAVRLVGQSGRRTTRFEFLIYMLLLLANVALAFAVLNAAWWDTWTALPLIIVGGLIVFAYRAYLRLTKRFGALQHLYDFGRSLGGSDIEPDQTVWAVLERVQSVMRANRAEVILVHEWPYGSRIALVDDQRVTVERIVLDESAAVAQVISECRASRQVGSVDSAGGEPTVDPVVGPFHDALIAPLTSGNRVFGALLALDRQEQLDAFDEEDLRLFEALADHASTTLERARLVEELRLEAESRSYQAMHDTLTGLPNRTLFLERASAALAETGRAAVALLDLDRFKEVNDTLGHETGDRLLCEVAECLVRAAHGRATVARLGGDEFALIVTDIIGPEEAIGIVRDLEAALTKPMNVDGIRLAVSASAGIALSPEHGDNVSTLLQRADIAMYLAKERRSGIELYSPTEDENIKRKLLLSGQLAHALALRQLHVVYQPIADLSTGAVIRAEALARWDHPDLGQIPAEEFIGIAVQMGLISEITNLVLTEGCAQAARWRDEGTPIGLSVNLSGRDLAQHLLVERVAAQLTANDLPASLLTLEVTETEFMADLNQVSRVLSELGELGVRVAVDDYGTGYSSLAYLHRLPVTELKIDRSFVTNVATDQSNAIIVRSSIKMAHSLGLSVVAEGAEDEITCAVLADAGCDAVQGYHLSRPMTAAAFGQWLATTPRLDFSPELPSPLRVIAGQLQSLRTEREEMAQVST